MFLLSRVCEIHKRRDFVWFVISRFCIKTENGGTSTDNILLSNVFSAMYLILAYFLRLFINFNLCYCNEAFSMHPSKSILNVLILMEITQGNTRCKSCIPYQIN